MAGAAPGGGDGGGGGGGATLPDAGGDEGAPGARSAAPLAGILVVDLGRIIAGPFCSFLFASLGADVVRVEAPGGDTSWRAVPFVGLGGRANEGQRRPDEIPLSHVKRGRGKRNVVVDYTTPRGRDVLHALIARADVLVENFRPDVLERLGLDYPTLSARYPRLVYCAISGYGLTGPKRDWPAMDVAIQAASGFMARTGFPDGPPVKSGVTVGDQVPGIYAVLGGLAALRRRDRTGRGGLVDVSMFDVLTSLLWDDPLDWYERRGLGERWGNSDPRGGPLNVYLAAEGWLALVISSDEHWRRLCRLMGREDLSEEIRTHNDRLREMPRIDEAVGAWAGGGRAEDLAAQLRQLGIPGAAAASPLVAREDPQAAARRILRTLVHPDSPDVPSGFLGPVLPVRFDDEDVELAPAEHLGQSSRAVLAEMLGLADEELDALAADGVIEGPGDRGTG